VVNIDETTLQVMDEPGRANTTKSYMWVFVGGPPGQRVILYQYHPTRAGSVARDFLNGYRGFIQTDGYEGYASLGEQEGVFHAGCWAHVRRKFFEAKSISKKAGSADEALSRIGALYRVEKTLRSDLKLSPEEFAAERRRQVIPILDSFREWLDERVSQVPPSMLLGKAISYAIGQWPKLVRYLYSHELTPDNNICENAIRPFVVGRKNFLFAGSPVGAYASAALYSLVESAKANEIEPYLYLRHVFSNLPESDDPEAFRPFLPYSIKKEDLLSFDRVRLV
jgi:transposase